MKRTYSLVIALLLSVVVVAARKNVSHPVQQDLSGHAVALWGSHGLYYNADQGRWTWQRARLWTTVEDLFTSSFTAPYLVPMLENAGAKVYQPRAYVRPGYQTVYVRWLTKGKKKHPQEVLVHHGDQTTAYTLDTSVGVGLWHYLCTVPKGACSVEGAEYQIVDEHTLGVSGYPRFMEAARYWLPDIGVPDEAWFKDSMYNDYLNDIVCRGGWVNYLCQSGIPLDMSLAFHTDAGATMTDSLVGTLLIYTKNDASSVLADSIMTQVVGDIRRAYCPAWPRRDLRKANYGETRDPKVPAVLLELLSHQNLADMRYALNPRFRHDVARAIYKGIGRFLAAQAGHDFVPQPLPPTALHTALMHDSVRLTWRAVQDSLEPAAAPTSYVVYTRADDGDWDESIPVSDTSYLFRAVQGRRYDLSVVAVNEGGSSMRSTAVSVFRAADTAPQSPWLIVDAFDEVRGPYMTAFDSLTGGIVPGSMPIPDSYEIAYIGEQINYNRRDPWHTDDDCGFGMCNTNRQGQLLVGNTHDYAVRHGRVLQRLNISYVSCTSDALTQADSIHTYIDMIAGKNNAESVRALNTWVQQLGWTQGNKRLLMSGAYLGYPHHACASGQILFNGDTCTFRQELNTERLSAEDVSAVTPLTPSDRVLARYSDTRLPAVIQGTNYILCGFPLETLDRFEYILTQFIQ